MKKTIILITIITLAKFTSGQSKFPFPDSSRLYTKVECDTFPDVDENCIDSKGRRQGRWEFRNEVIYNIPIDDIIIGKKVKKQKQDLPISEGYYKNGKRTGLWCFYNHSTYYSWDHLNFCIFNIGYYEDSVVYTSGFYHNKRIVYNRDSTKIHGSARINIYKRDKYEVVKFQCLDGECKFWDNKRPDLIIEQCKLENLEYYVERFSTGVYDRQINYNRIKR